MNSTPNVRQKCLTFGGVFFMSKYSLEFKLEVVRYCIEEHHGCEDASKYFGIPSPENIRQWCKRYQLYGTEGLLKNLKSSYDGEFKKNVVEYMHTNHLSATETAIQFKIGNTNHVLKWERIYYEEGPQALYEERRGRSKKMSSTPRKKELSKENEEDLIEEVQRLRMENAYLKKLQALVQERTKPKQEKKQ